MELQHPIEPNTQEIKPKEAYLKPDGKVDRFLFISDLQIYARDHAVSLPSALRVFFDQSDMTKMDY